MISHSLQSEDIIDVSFAKFDVVYLSPVLSLIKMLIRSSGSCSGFGATCRKQTLVHSGEASKQREDASMLSAEVLRHPGRLQVERLDLFWRTSELQVAYKSRSQNRTLLHHADVF